MLSWFQSKTSARSRVRPHITYQRSSVGKTLLRTKTILKTQIWIWPVIAICILSLLGWTVRSSIETIMKNQLRSELQTLLDIEIAMLNNWYASNQANAESFANNFEFRTTVQTLVTEEGKLESDSTASNQEGIREGSFSATQQEMQRKLVRLMSPALSNHDYVSYFVATVDRQIVASSRKELVGRKNVPSYASFVDRALDGETVVCVPFRSEIQYTNREGKQVVDLPVMWVAAPIRDAEFQVIGVLALQIDPLLEFTRVLQLGRIGLSGETYAFNREGTFVSNSRFDNDLILMGLLPDTLNSKSILTLGLRDPGGNMLEGFRSQARRSTLPLTNMASKAIRGENGVDVDGYRDYRGVPVVGAWTWLPKYEIGVATEIDYAEAFRPLSILQMTFWGLFTLLAASSVAIFVFSLRVSRLQRQAQQAAVEAQKIGQYTLEQKIGAGGMGVVYRGRHGMLKRATAIKMLNLDKVNDGMIARFEREVQITSQLNHPNTIAIFDYGRTEEGVFYYAMEYLDGVDLQTLVDEYGPQPVPRVINILKQCCGSLNEAHSQGLVHRDIKPGNIMINYRGGTPDVVKVLDFGLVMEADARMSLDGAGMTGTPLYMSPEAIQSPGSIDARSDIYALGAVAYFLLTGQPVFEAESIVELCRKHLSEEPIELTKRYPAGNLPSELNDLVLACLDKSRGKRPQTMREIYLRLERIGNSLTWDLELYEAWWTRRRRGTLSTAKKEERGEVANTTERAHAERAQPAQERQEAATKTQGGVSDKTEGGDPLRTMDF